MPLTATIKASIAAKLTGSNDMGTPAHEFIEAFSLLLEDGTGANQASNVWSDERTLAASATEDLDLAGSLVNGLGATLTFTAVKAIMVIASAANTNSVIVGAAAVNTFVGPFGAAAHTVAVKPGGFFFAFDPSAAGLAVTAGTGDLLRIANGGAGSSVTYRIVIVGEA